MDERPFICSEDLELNSESYELRERLVDVMHLHMPKLHHAKQQIRFRSFSIRILSLREHSRGKIEREYRFHRTKTATIAIAELEQILRVQGFDRSAVNTDEYQMTLADMALNEALIRQRYSFHVEPLDGTPSIFLFHKEEPIHHFPLHALEILWLIKS